MHACEYQCARRAQRNTTHRREVNTIAHGGAREHDPLRGVSLELDSFFESEERRQRVLEMQDRIRPGRTKPIAIRLDQFTVRRLKALAALHNIGYQTLLKEFVVERLYEEERRAGILVCAPPPR
jgi:hypothetical protein